MGHLRSNSTPYQRYTSSNIIALRRLFINVSFVPDQLKTAETVNLLPDINDDSLLHRHLLTKHIWLVDKEVNLYREVAYNISPILNIGFRERSNLIFPV